MATEEYSVGYNEGYQEGWNAALGSAPPKREWVDLTDDEIEDVRRKTFMAFQDAIAGRGAGKLDATNYAKNLIDAFKEKNR